MQDDVTPGWAKKSKPTTTGETTPPEPENPLDIALDGDEPDIIIDETEQPETDQGVDEKKLEEEYGPAPESNDTTEVSPKPPVHKRPWAWLTGLSKKRKIIYGSLAVVVIATVTICLVLLGKPAPEVPTLPVYHAPTSTTVPSTLTGLQVDPAINKLQVTGVMIENSVFARPQSSLNQAGLVFEAVAEAGITRFMALFQDTKSEYIGPVRSARPYYVQWCQAFDCALAHVGGSPEALKDLKTYKVKNLDQFAGGSYFHRINSRYAPHNVYTSQTELGKYEKSRGYTQSTYTGLQHLLKEPKVAAASATVNSVKINYPSSAYDVSYSYRTTTNDYARSEGGKPHKTVDAKGNLAQITPKVVIALVAPYSLKGDGYHSQYKSVGTGTVYVFQNGGVTKGTWTRTARDSQFILTTENNQAIKLNPGQTWISVISKSSDVTYK